MKISLTRAPTAEGSLSLIRFSLYLRSDKGKWTHRTRLSMAELKELVAQGQQIIDQVEGQL